MEKEKYPRVKLQITCVKCKAESSLEKSFIVRDGENHLKEVGMLCAKCGHFVLAYKTTKQLELLRERVQDAKRAFEQFKSKDSEDLYNRLKETYETLFMELNPKDE